MTTRSPNASQPDTEPTEAELQAKAAAITGKRAQKADDPGKTLLALGGIALGGWVLKSLLSTPGKRFRADAAGTAKAIGEAIRLRRLDLGMTQQELATRSGTRERFISEVERGKETAEVGKVLDLLDALDLEARIIPRS
ncbi:helix-turn-helix domain-containing protein [Pseudodesulfovibrio pelocollis]|uniref:helix-turn-helix domain-containing protein n=1 Tax=Pseudodesulfovibrio pelocollis TaxID=3051432 RepID=UPI00255A7E3F|nr:helix-turn-helix domain-containing protein [Pseudodesulfovibrio sp. SB368]